MFGPGKKENSSSRASIGTRRESRAVVGGTTLTRKRRTTRIRMSIKSRRRRLKRNLRYRQLSLYCDRCAKQVKEALEDVEGVEKVECDQINRKVWVKGSVKPEVVLKKVRKLKKDAELVVQKKQN